MTAEAILLIEDATRRAEMAVSKLHFFAPSNRFADDELYEVWDQLQAAAEAIRAARIRLGFRDPRS